MIDIEIYTQKLISECKRIYGDRLIYVGLQGSYMRGEAGENSDLDIMIIIENFSIQDMDAYREMLKQIGDYDRSCLWKSCLMIMILTGLMSVYSNGVRMHLHVF